jgi:hypothetical protein
MVNMNTRVASLIFIEDRPCFVDRTVINNDEFKIAKTLQQDAFHGYPEETGAVENTHDNGNEWSFHLSGHFPYEFLRLTRAWKKNALTTFS